MQLCSPPNDGLTHQVKTTQVLGDIVDRQLAEAAWCAMSRLRQLAQPNGSLMTLRRWERNLCGNMAGLASVMSPRLMARLQKMLLTPEDLVSETFIAALLLLRCDRAQCEGAVVRAWRQAPSGELQEYLTQALIHADIASTDHAHQVIDILQSQEGPPRHRAARIVCARRLPLPRATTDALLPKPTKSSFEPQLALELMACGALPFCIDILSNALLSRDCDQIHAAEQALLVLCPKALVERTRLRLQRGDDPSLLGLEALACNLLGSSKQQRQVDLDHFAALANKGRMGPLAAHALGLSGLNCAAELCLRQINQAADASMLDCLIEAFLAITGIEATPIPKRPSGAVGPLMAQELQKAWRPLQVQPNDAGTLQWFGHPFSAAHVQRSLPLMQVGRWQSLGRMLQCRSLGAIRLSGWALVEQQLAELAAFGPLIDGALSSNCAAEQQQARMLALRHRGALR